MRPGGHDPCDAWPEGEEGGQEVSSLRLGRARTVPSKRRKPLSGERCSLERSSGLSHLESVLCRVQKLERLPKTKGRSPSPSTRSSPLLFPSSSADVEPSKEVRLQVPPFQSELWSFTRQHARASSSLCRTTESELASPPLDGPHSLRRRAHSTGSRSLPSKSLTALTIPPLVRLFPR